MPRSTTHRGDDPDDDWGDGTTRRRFALFMYGFGAIMCATSPLLPDADPRDHGWLLAFGAALGACFALMLLLPQWTALSRWAGRLGVLFVSLLVAVAVPVGGVPYFYVWPVLYAAMLLPRRELYVAIALVVVTFPIAFALQRGDHDVVILISAMASPIGAAVVVRVTRTQRDALEVELRQAAATDALTGLPNRRAFDATLREASAAATPERPMALVMLDVDRFKLVNDRYGHAVGDLALQVVADGLREAAPDGRPARIGGEEFALVLAESDERDALRVIDELDRILVLGDARLPPQLHLGISAGIVISPGERDRESLLHAADAALYRAKDEGRGRAIVGRLPPVPDEHPVDPADGPRPAPPVERASPVAGPATVGEARPERGARLPVVAARGR